MSLEVTVVSRSKQIFHGDASYVSAPAHHGKVGILPGRQPFLASMQAGEVEVTLVEGDSKEVIPVQEGFISVDSDQVMIVVDSF